MVKLARNAMPVMFAAVLIAAVGYADTMRVDVGDDTVVKSAYPTKPFGTAKELYAGLYVNSVGSQTYRSYLKFDLSGLPEDSQVTKASLFVYYRWGSAGTAPVIVARTAADGWDQAALTWNMALEAFEPAAEPSAVHTFPTTAGEVELDVTSLVQPEAEGDGVASIVLMEDGSGTTSWVRLIAKEEDPLRAAYLLVEYEQGKAPDTTPPVIDLVVLKDQLWPPNHTLVMCAKASALDNEDPAPKVEVVVTSNEPINGKGDGNTDPDWDVKDNNGAQDVWLMAERSGSGDGRVYTIKVTATDASGNAASAKAEVKVPRDQGKKGK